LRGTQPLGKNGGFHQKWDVLKCNATMKSTAGNEKAALFEDMNILNLLNILNHLQAGDIPFCGLFSPENTTGFPHLFRCDPPPRLQGRGRPKEPNSVISPAMFADTRRRNPMVNPM
jgi:hypothetical protein